MNGDYQGSLICRKSPHQEWVKWAQKIVEDYPHSLNIDSFCNSFLYGLGKQNVRVLASMGLLKNDPIPASDSIHSGRYLDVPALILVLHLIQVPSESRLIIMNFLYEKGLIVPDKQHQTLYFDSPRDF